MPVRGPRGGANSHGRGRWRHLADRGRGRGQSNATHEAGFRIIEIVEAVLFSSRKRATPGQETSLATVAQPCGYPVDGQMDCLHHALVGIASPVTLQQFDLHMVERIEVGKAVLD
jgi:hypothetical protein